MEKTSQQTFQNSPAGVGDIFVNNFFNSKMHFKVKKIGQCKVRSWTLTILVGVFQLRTVFDFRKLSWEKDLLPWEQNGEKKWICFQTPTVPIVCKFSYH